MRKSCRRILWLLGWCAVAAQAHAQLKLPAIIADHMVLQRGQANPIWGWDDPGVQVTVRFAGQSQVAVAAADGRWRIWLSAMPATATPQTLTIAGSSERKLEDVLVGEVWLCSGQSNMDMKLAQSANADRAADLPHVRLHLVPQAGEPENPDELRGAWRRATPATARAFSAVGFLFGRQLHEILGVPVGLVDVSWGGSTTEAWIPREALASDPRFHDLMAEAAKKDAAAASPEGRAAYARAVADWEVALARAAAANQPPPGGPPNWLAGGTRPGNLFAKMIAPLAGYGMRGVIWYQGEANTARAREHGQLFPLLIGQWREEWRQGDFSFYWVQLPGFGPEQPEPAESHWAELRETQASALRLPNTGQAVALDLGDAHDIHPRDKHQVAARLASWALHQNYGRSLPYRSPEFRRLHIEGHKVRLEFDCFGSSLHTRDQAAIRGFAVCGPDRVWHRAAARITSASQVELVSAEVPAPLAVRYAWADNPAINLVSAEQLPVAPFRTDDFPPGTPPPSGASRAGP